MKILVVIDMQNDFISGVLGTKEAQIILPAVKEKIEKCKSDGYEIIFTRDTHGENYLTTQEGKNLPVAHCIKNTFGWQIADGLDTSSGKIFDKEVFGSVALAEYLSSLKDLEEIELVGVCTDICVISNAVLIKSFLPETPVFVDSTCCAGVTPQSHENALACLKMLQVEIR
ncbi:MAG: cysteine hydrolase family protein [Acutalibacteraceae bacterium]